MSDNIYGFTTTTWISTYSLEQEKLPPDSNGANLYILPQDQDPLSFIEQFNLSSWELSSIREKIKKQKEKKDSKDSYQLLSIKGTPHPVWVAVLADIDQTVNSSMQSISKSNFYLSEDLGGSFVKEVSGLASIKSIQIDFNNYDSTSLIGFLVGMELASYNFKDCFNSYLKNTDPKTKPTLYFKNIDKSLVDKASTLSLSINLGRHLENLPANIINPESFKNICLDIFKTDSIKVEVNGPDKLKKLGLNLITTVASGSKKPSYMIRLIYRSNNKNSKYVSLVGKGITFDSGGLDIKTASGMLLMKKDMSGAATLLATCYLVSILKPEVNCDFYLMLAENSVSDSSYHPGDVILTKNNVTVEIHNTDAEGRLLLADGLAQALADNQNSKDLILIDIATLTGANRMALGPSIMGMYTDDEDLSKTFKEVSYKIGQPLWHMPVFEDYKKNLESHSADIKNACQENGGGAISATLFLKHFTQNARHVHFDMYAYTDKPSSTILEPGSNGQGIALLSEYLANLI